VGAIAESEGCVSSENEEKSKKTGGEDKKLDR